MLAEQADQVMIEFVPEVGNKWAKLAIFVSSLIGIFGKKYFSFEKEQVEKRKKAKIKPEEQAKVTVIENV